MKVLYFAAECKPFSKTGGVGDVAGELPPELKRQGIDIEVVTPLYGKIKPEHFEEKIADYSVRFHGKDEPIEIYLGNLDGVPVNFVKNPTYFEGGYSEPYINSVDIPFHDDALRFSFFSEACLPLISFKNPDIVHINDWVLGYLFGKMVMGEMLPKRVLTIHNVGYQGNIGIDAINDWLISDILRDGKLGPLFRDPHPEWNSVNALRLGLELSDMANTVSPNYCKEMTMAEDQSRYFEGGRGLHEIAKRQYEEGKLIGILNGFNYKFVPTNKSFNETISKKNDMKGNIGKDFADPDAFLLGFVGRAVEQKFRLLTEAINGKSVLEHILDIPGVNVAVLATGLPEYESFIRDVSAKSLPESIDVEDPYKRQYRKNYSFTIAFDREKAQQISLGSDVFLMPSLFEPCGITQMESLNNATPPLVRWTGGLVDTVKPHNRRNGTGFGFDGTTRQEVLQALINTVHEALKMYKDNKDAFKQLQKIGFRERFLWSASAKKYIEELYLPALKKKGKKHSKVAK